MSLRDFPFLLEMIGGFVKIVFSDVPSIFAINFLMPGGILVIKVCGLLAFVCVQGPNV